MHAMRLWCMPCFVEAVLSLFTVKPCQSAKMPFCMSHTMGVFMHPARHVDGNLVETLFWKCFAFSQVIPFLPFLLLCGRHPFTQDSMTVQCPSSFDYPWIHQPQLVEPSCWPSLGPPCLPIFHAMHLCHLYMHACAYARVFPLLVDSVFPAQCIH